MRCMRLQDKNSSSGSSALFSRSPENYLITLNRLKNHENLLRPCSNSRENLAAACCNRHEVSFNRNPMIPLNVTPLPALIELMVTSPGGDALVRYIARIGSLYLSGSAAMRCEALSHGQPCRESTSRITILGVRRTFFPQHSLYATLRHV